MDMGAPDDGQRQKKKKDGKDKLEGVKLETGMEEEHPDKELQCFYCGKETRLSKTGTRTKSEPRGAHGRCTSPRV